MKMTCFALVAVALVLFSTNTAAQATQPTPPSTRTASDSPSKQPLGYFLEEIRAASKSRSPIRIVCPTRPQVQKRTICPRPPTVQVMRGGTVEVPLTAGRGILNRNLNRLEYKPIAAPRYGKLSQLTQYQGPKGQAFGSVIYTHGNDPNSVTDSFVYEVTDPTSGLRWRGRMIIRILDAPPVSGP